MEKVTRAEYQAVEAEFMTRTDALCEDVRPEFCDCSACPCAVLCKWLCNHEGV